MALKFLNKKGWHTGSLRNIENVWKAEQKYDAEQKKLEELRKQIQEEKEKAEFRRLQEEAGLVPSQERLDFLYDSGLAVGKGSSSGFKALESYPPRPIEENAAAASSSQQPATPAAPGALFEDKPQSANDAWRKLHSDPLLMIRQREQEALARIRNNPVKMAMIRKSVESKKQNDKTRDVDQNNDESRHKRHSSIKHKSDSKKKRTNKDDNQKRRRRRDASSPEDERRGRSHRRSNKDSDRDSHPERRYGEDSWESKRSYGSLKDGRGHVDIENARSIREGRALRNDRKSDRKVTEDGMRYRSSNERSKHGKDAEIYGHEARDDPRHRRGNTFPKLSEEERAARVQEMQMDAEVHEEQRWKRLRKAEKDDVREASRDVISRGRSFLDAAQKSVYGAEKGGSSTIEQSVRRRAYFSQGRLAADGNAFRR